MPLPPSRSKPSHAPTLLFSLKIILFLTNCLPSKFEDLSKCRHQGDTWVRHVCRWYQEHTVCVWCYHWCQTQEQPKGLWPLLRVKGHGRMDHYQLCFLLHLRKTMTEDHALCLFSWASSSNFSLFSTPLYPPSPLDLGGRKDCLRFSCLMFTIIWGTTNGHSSSSLGICFGFLAVALFWGDWSRTYISPRPVSGAVLKGKISTQDPQGSVLSTKEMYLLQRGKG